MTNLVDKDFTVAWWERVLFDENKLCAWLGKLYVTEYEGHQDNLNANEKWNPEGNKFIDRIFRTTAKDELYHASILSGIIQDRYWYVPNALEKTPKNTSIYWAMMDEAIVDLETCCAVFHLGERLAAERFQIILDHNRTPRDVASFIKLALPDEEYHAAAFKHLAGDEAIQRVFEIHEKALAATLGKK